MCDVYIVEFYALFIVRKFNKHFCDLMSSFVARLTEEDILEESKISLSFVKFQNVQNLTVSVALRSL